MVFKVCAAQADGLPWKSCVTASILLVVGVSGCEPEYGANFGYPKTPTVPPGASIVSKDSGRNDDVPMRGREIVFDTHFSEHEVVNFYRERFGQQNGWATEASSVGDNPLLLCVVKHSKEYDQYLELYSGDATDKEGRFTVRLSRLEALSKNAVDPGDRCGTSIIYYP